MFYTRSTGHRWPYVNTAEKNNRHPWRKACPSHSLAQGRMIHSLRPGLSEYNTLTCPMSHGRGGHPEADARRNHAQPPLKLHAPTRVVIPCPCLVGIIVSAVIRCQPLA